VGTALGREGTGVFGKVWREMETVRGFERMQRAVANVQVSGRGVDGAEVEARRE
jgi:hypothetical protein